MRNLFLLKLFFVLMMSNLITPKAHAFEVFKKNYLYSKDHFIATIYTTKDGGEDSLAEIKTYVNSIFRNVSFKDQQIANKPININENRFFIGKEDKIVTVIKFADFPIRSQINFAKNYCIDTDCDVVYQGDYLEEFSTFSRSFTPTKSDLVVLKNKVSFIVKSNAPGSLKKAITAAHDGDIIYSGVPGKIHYFKKNYFETPEIEYRVHIHLKGEKLPVYNSYIEQDAIDAIKLLTNATCVSSNKTRIFTSCDRSPMFPEDSTSDVILSKVIYPTGEAIISTPTPQTRDTLEKMLEELNPYAISSAKDTRFSFKSNLKPYSHPTKLLNSIKIKYMDKGQLLVETQLQNIDKDRRSTLHDFIVETYKPTSYQIYAPSSNGDLLVSEHSLSKNKKFSQMADSTIYKKYLELGINFKNNTNVVDAPYDIRYLNRSELPSFATASANIEYWPFRFPIGFSTNINYYSIVHESVDLSGNVTKHNGTNLYFDALTHFKYLMKKSKRLTELQLGLGIENKIFSVDENSSVGNLNIMNAVAKFEYRTWFKKYRLSANIQFNYLLSFDQEFSGQQDITNTNGIGVGVGLKLSKRIDKQAYAHLGFDYMSSTLTLDDYSVTIGDTAFYLGLSYRWGEQ